MDLEHPLSHLTVHKLVPSESFDFSESPSDPVQKMLKRRSLIQAANNASLKLQRKKESADPGLETPPPSPGLDLTSQTQLETSSSTHHTQHDMSSPQTAGSNYTTSLHMESPPDSLQQETQSPPSSRQTSVASYDSNATDIESRNSLTSVFFDSKEAPADPRKITKKEIKQRENSEMAAGTAGTTFTTPTTGTVPSTNTNSTTPASPDGTETTSATITASSANASAAAASEMNSMYPFLRAVHAFDARSLETHDKDSVCLSFKQTDCILLHGMDVSGWGDATLLHTGERGWVPTNFFQPFQDPEANALLVAVQKFATNPKCHPTKNGHTFSQNSVNSVIAGVRALLQACGALTRDSPAVRSSNSTKKFRKMLLAELAVFVGQARESKNSTDDELIQSLVQSCYNVVCRAVVFLDIYNLKRDKYGTPLGSSVDSTFRNSVASAQSDTSTSSHGRVSGRSSRSGPPPSPRKESATGEDSRQSVVLHKTTPFAKARLDEVYEALMAYLSLILRLLNLLDTAQDDGQTISSQILYIARKSIVASRALIAATEDVSNRTPRTRRAELEATKDKLYRLATKLCATTRELVIDEGATPEYANELVRVVNKCAKTAGECVSRSKAVLEATGDFQLSNVRSYPDLRGTTVTINSFYSLRPDSAPAGESTASEAEEELPPSTADTDDTTELTMHSNASTESTATVDKPYYKLTSAARLRRSVVIDEEGDEGNSTVMHDDDHTAVNEPGQLDETKEKHASLLPPLPHVAPMAQGETVLISEEVGDVSGITMTSMGEDTVDLSTFDPTSNDLGTVPVEDQLIVGDQGQIQGGSIQALVKHITSTVDPFFVSVFFLSFRRFCTPIQLAEFLVERSQKPDEDVVIRVFNTFKQWLESYWKAGDIEALPLMRSFSETLAQEHNNSATVLKNLVGKAQDPNYKPPITKWVAVANTGRPAMSIYNSGAVPSSNVSKSQLTMISKFFDNVANAASDTGNRRTASLTSNPNWAALRNVISPEASISIIGFDAFDIARQLTLIDNELFCKIKTEEFMDLNFASKKRKMGKAPNVGAMTFNTNKLSALVGDSILRHGLNAKQRKNILKQWIKIGDKCLELGNFNSLLTIVSALQSVSIMRLRKTWEMLSPRYQDLFASLKAIVLPEKNFVAYRSRIRQQDIPCVPYLGVYLTDLTFIEEGNADKRLYIPQGDGHAPSVSVINFDKHARTAKIVGEIQRFQIPYRLQPVKELQQWLHMEMDRAQSLISEDSNGLWRRSCIVEPK
ncbi:Ras guanine nucleotide exchange factor Y [Yarrowia sp. C11]|nr:Ras guanine nucleotide exchange factor Y [Yarrowia sp. E02]KAG5371840.1 Ras guanine nucleotide exchange factor Y [Yarrowia sp. C11]